VIVDEEADREAAEWEAAKLAVLEDEIEMWREEQLREMASLFPLYSPDWARDIVQGAVVLNIPNQHFGSVLVPIRSWIQQSRAMFFHDQKCQKKFLIWK